MTRKQNYFSSFRYVLLFPMLFFGADPVEAADRYWVGGSDNNFNSSSNWSSSSGGSSGASVPGKNDKIIFDGGSDDDCMINATMEVKEVEIKSSYTGTISVASGHTFNVSCCGFTQSGGIFSGRGGTVTIYGGFDLSGGVFDFEGELNVFSEGDDSGGIDHVHVVPPIGLVPDQGHHDIPEADIYMGFESSSEPEIPQPYRDPDPNGNGNGCMSGKKWNDFYHTNICLAESQPFSDFALERSREHSRKGNFSFRVLIKPSPPSNWPPGEATHRVELAPSHDSPVERYPLEGEERWYGASYYFPKDFVFAPHHIAQEVRFIITQWQHGSAGSPALAFEIVEDEIVLEHETGESLSPNWHEPSPIAQIEKGVWIDIITRVVWHKTNGLVQVWVNDQKKYDERNTQTMYTNIDNGGGMKIGMYYWRFKEKESVEKALAAGIDNREIYIDEVREYLGKDGYEIVKPGRETSNVSTRIN